jgi:hypothetical protein
VSGLINVPAVLSRWKVLPLPATQKVGRDPKRFWPLCRTDISLDHSENGTTIARDVQPVAYETHIRIVLICLSDN